MRSNKVFLTTNIRNDFDLKIESVKNIEYILPFIKSNGSCNILIIEKEKNPQSLFSHIIALLDETFHLVDSCPKDWSGDVMHINLDMISI